METEKRLGFPPVAHIGYIVDCIEDNVAAFTALCGIKKFDVYEFKPLRAWAFGTEIFDCHFQIAMGVTENGSDIELIKPISGNTPQMEFLERCGGGIHHFSLSVKNFDIWRLHVKSIKNASIIFEAEVCDKKRGYRRCIYVKIGKTCPIVEIAEIPIKRSKKERDIKGNKPF